REQAALDARRRFPGGRVPPASGQRRRELHRRASRRAQPATRRAGVQGLHKESTTRGRLERSFTAHTALVSYELDAFALGRILTLLRRIFAENLAGRSRRDPTRA